MNTDFGTHIMNSEEKRMEPKATLCCFCKQAHSTAMHENYFVDVYREQKRTNIVVYRSVNFNQIKIGIPRCTECMNTHYNSSIYASVIAVVGIVSLVVLSFYIHILLGFIAFLLSLGVIAVIQPIIANKMIHQSGILTKRECAEDDPMVVDLIVNGWSLNKPMA
jgi:hypothetical protein